MKRIVNVVIAEPSFIIRSGLISVLKKISDHKFNATEIDDFKKLQDELIRNKTEILFINPAYLGVFNFDKLKRSGYGGTEPIIVALCSSLYTDGEINKYDKAISIYDTPNSIKDKILALISQPDEDSETKPELTQRETDIVVCVAKGMTNKQIAEEFCLSTHTIMTHRRNISAKLQIHSPAGITVYAIANKLVNIKDIDI